MLKRRSFLVAMAGLGSLLTPLGILLAKTTDKSIEAIRNGWRKLLPAGADVPEPSDPIEKTDADWRTELRPEAYQVLFKEDTEPPFTSPLNDEHRPGVFTCAACNLPLFTSEMKFDSGTGWPSFITHIPGHLDTKTDFKLIWPRTEYHCVRCGGHQGHVFDDGPAPTGERWCNNGVALNFIAADSPS